MSADPPVDRGPTSETQAEATAPAAVSLEQINLEEPSAESTVQQNNADAEQQTDGAGVDESVQTGTVEAHEEAQHGQRSSLSAGVDAGCESVGTSMQSLDISSDGTDSAFEHLMMAETQQKHGLQQRQQPQEEWVCLKTPDGYWYWLNTVTGVSQWAESTEQEATVNWLHKYAVAGSVEEVQQVVRRRLFVVRVMEKQPVR